MKFEVKLLPDAEEDLNYFTAFEQRIIMSAIKEYLSVDANVETKRRKQLQANPIAPWELRRGQYRIFYDIVDTHGLTPVALENQSSVAPGLYPSFPETRHIA